MSQNERTAKKKKKKIVIVKRGYAHSIQIENNTF